MCDVWIRIDRAENGIGCPVSGWDTTGPGIASQCLIFHHHRAVRDSSKSSEKPNARFLVMMVRPLPSTLASPLANAIECLEFPIGDRVRAREFNGRRTAGNRTAREGLAL